MPDKWFIANDGCLHDTTKVNWVSTPLRKNYAQTHREIKTVQDLKATLRAGEFAWPGGYQLVLYASDGEELCFDCVRTEFGQCCWSIKNEVSDGWRIVSCDALYESLECDTLCAHCNKVLMEESEIPDYPDYEEMYNQLKK